MRAASGMAFIVGVLALVATPVRAQEPSVDSRRDEAKRRFERGALHHEAGEYDLAIADFQAAYALSHAPLLIFNIAQSLRLKGDCAAAAAEYRRFVEAAPTAPNRGRAEHWM